MGTLAITRSLVSNTNPTEAQFDTMRTGLLNFFNTASLNQDNIAAGGMLWSSLPTTVPDDITIKWTSSHGTLAYLNATDKFKIQNTQGDILWAHRTGATLTEFMSLRYTDGALEVFGVPNHNTAVGAQTVSLLWILSRYRKPRLVYSDGSIFTIEENSTSVSETLVVARDRVWKIYDRTCSLAVDANGETAADVGTAVSGRAAGIARTPNRWYYVYAVEVQYGTQADGINAILVAHTTSPESANIATLNTAFGTGKWVYMGLVRNGYNITGSTDIIVPFIYDESGYMHFTQSLTTNYPKGLELASDNDTDNLSYDLVIGNAAAATIPPVATRVIFGGHRQSHGFELHYREIASLENHMIASGCYHVTELATLTPVVYMEVPLLAGYRLVVVIGNVITQKRISLAGLLDHYA